MWKLCLGQVTVDFFNCPNMETFAFWDFLSQTLRIMIKHWSNDVCGFKMMLTKNLNFWLSNDHFAPTVDCSAISVLTVQFCAESLETLYEDAGPCLSACETWLGPWKLHFLCQNQNPSFWLVGSLWTVQPLGRFWSMFFENLEEYGRANFGVQQLPLFNLLRPEDVDWLVCLS